MLRLAIVALITLGLSAEAKANWQYARWGMSPQEVSAASAGLVSDTSDQERKDHKRGQLTPLNKAPYETQTFTFVAFFYYTNDGNKLQEVALHLRSGSPDDLEMAMQDRYGAATSKRFDSLVRLMVWELDDMFVRFVHIVGGPPTVEYAARKTARSKGL